jgi:hypothetical protein
MISCCATQREGVTRHLISVEMASECGIKHIITGVVSGPGKREQARHRRGSAPLNAQEKGITIECYGARWGSFRAR